MSDKRHGTVSHRSRIDSDERARSKAAREKYLWPNEEMLRRECSHDPELERLGGPYLPKRNAVYLRIQAAYSEETYLGKFIGECTGF